MIKKLLTIFLFALAHNAAFSQNGSVDSLSRQLHIAKDDTSRVLILSNLGFSILFFNADSGLIYVDRAIDLAEKINFTRGKIRALAAKASLIETKGDLPEALKLSFGGLELAEQQKLLMETSICLTTIGNIFYDLNDYSRAVGFYRQALPANEAIKNEPGAPYWKYQTEVNLGTCYMLNNQYDSSFTYLEKAYAETMNDATWHPVFSMFFGDLQFRMGHRETGITYLKESLRLFQHDSPYAISDVCRMLARCYRDMNMPDSAIYFADRALRAAQSIGYQTTVLEASKLLSELYEVKDLKMALYYRKVFDTTNNILYGTNKVKNLQKTLLNEQDRQREIEAKSIAYKNRIKQYGLLVGLLIILFVAFLLYRNNVQRRKSNVILNLQKEQLETTLLELKSTQSQLIQSEKMASLGELTAGIAHEIQNPLNFVNNFSEVSKELLDEMKTELNNGNTADAKDIADDVIQNLEKINHHGKRADAIVKGMLQHSQSSSGKKEPTDINKLANEYLKLAYHGLRGKDKAFNVTMQTDFDESIGNINIVPQDIGRVLLNLYNNAFFATNEKSKQNIESYEPTVQVAIKKSGDKILISVKDNGNGIPQKVIDKIFQPFFTTKPTGQGTGLGLSLSYDIIKAHSGEIKVETKENEGSEFIIQLPVSKTLEI